MLLSFNQARAQQWEVEIDKAMETARSENKNILLFFTLKDCETCSVMQKKVFSTEEFSNYTKNRFILVKIDFSSQMFSNSTKDDKILQIVEKYNRDGFFPFVVLADFNGRVLKKLPPYENQNIASYLKLLQ